MHVPENCQKVIFFISTNGIIIRCFNVFCQDCPLIVLHIDSTMDSRREHFLSRTGRESWELSSFIRARFIAIERSSLTVMYSSVRESYTYTLGTPTRRSAKWKGKKKKFSKAEIRKGRATNSPACLRVHSATFVCSPYIQTYTTGYHIRTYTQPCWCWPTVWTYLSKTSLVILQGRV